MAYTPPSYNAVNFEIGGTSYSPPTYNDVDFELGDGSSTQTYSQTGSGGALAAGAAAVAAVVVLAMSGGAVAAGTADVTTTTGGQVYTHVAAGGALAGGAADCAQYVVSQGAGGALAGGAALSSRTLSPTAGGGALAGGSSLYSVASSFSFDGGALAGGAADFTWTPFEPNIYSHSADGGSIVGGLADYDFDLVAVSIVLWADGGCLAGGSAPFSFTVASTAGGGAIVAGMANVDHSPASQATSSVTLPSSIDSAHIKSTSPSTSPEYANPVEPVDIPTLDLSGSAEYNAWTTNTNSYNGAKINIDYDANSFPVNKIRVRNFYNQGGGTTVGFTSFKLYGSNSSTDFNNTTLNSVPASGTLLRDTTTLNQDGGYGDDQIFTISNTTEYRYYIIMFSGTYGANIGGVRSVELYGPIPEINSSLSVSFPSLSATGYTRTSLINPPAFSATYVKSTSDYGSIYGDQWRVVDPSSSHSGSASYAAWLTNTNQIVGSKINIDYGSTGAFTANMLRLWNFHNSGAETDKGVASLRVYGSNTQSDFDDVTLNSVPASATLLLNTTAVARETSTNGTEQIFWFGNTTQYRYYILFFVSGHGHLNYTGIRKALLQGIPGPITGGLSVNHPAIRAFIDAQENGNIKITPVERTDTYVKAGFDYPAVLPAQTAPYAIRTDIDGGSLTGEADYNSILGTTGTAIFAFEANGRAYLDYFDIENYHDSGSSTSDGINSFSLYGGNSPVVFQNVESSIEIDSSLVQLYSGSASQHPATNTPDRQRFDVSSTESFRFFYLVATSNHGGSYFGFRRLTCWGAFDPRNIADLSVVLSRIAANITTGSPGISGSLSIRLKRMVVGLSDGPPPYVDSSLKPMTAFMTVDNFVEEVPVGDLIITLPSLTAENPAPALGEIRCTFPMANVSMAGANVASVFMPKLSATMTGPPASIASDLSVSIPTLSVGMMTGKALAVTIPGLVVDLFAVAQSKNMIGATLRRLSCVATATFSKTADNVDVALLATLPRSTMESSAIVGRSANMDSTLRRLSCSMRAIPGIVSRVSASMPRLTASGKGGPSWAKIEAEMSPLSADIETAHNCSSPVIRYNKESVQ
jgi:hypothetical protein